MALGRYYSIDSFKRIVNMLGKEDIIFLEKSAPVVNAIQDYELVVSIILKILNRDLNPYHPGLPANDELVTRICKIFHPVFVRLITNIDGVKDFLSRLDNKTSDDKNVLKACRFIFACHLHHAIHDSNDLETVLRMLYPGQHLKFASNQNDYWFVHQKNCRMAFLSGRSPNSLATYPFFKSLDRNIFIKIFEEADLLPKKQNAPALLK